MTKIPKLNSEELRTLKSVVSPAKPARAAAWSRSPAKAPVKPRDQRRVPFKGGEMTVADLGDLVRGLVAIQLGEITSKGDLARLQPMIRALVKAEVSARLATRGIREYR